MWSALRRFAAADCTEALDLLLRDLTAHFGTATIYVTAAVPDGDPQVRHEFPPHERTYGHSQVLAPIDKWVVDLGEPAWLPCIAEDPRVRFQSSTDLQVGSLYVVPLTVWGRTYGTLGLLWSTQRTISFREREQVSAVSSAIAGYVAVSLAVDSASVGRRALSSFSNAVRLVSFHRTKHASLNLLMDLGMNVVAADYAVLLALNGSEWTALASREAGPEIISDLHAYLEDPMPATDVQLTVADRNMLILTRLPDGLGKPILLVYGRTRAPFSADEVSLAHTFGELLSLLVIEQGHVQAAHEAVGLLVGYISQKSGQEGTWLAGVQLARDTARELLYDAEGQEVIGHLLSLLLVLTIPFDTPKTPLHEALSWLRPHLSTVSPTQGSQQMLLVAEVVAHYVLLKRETNAWAALRGLSDLPNLNIRSVHALETVVERQLVALFDGGVATAMPVLTQREREVLKCLGRGLGNREIAEALMISQKTVKVHVSRVLHKIGAGDRTKAAILALKWGLVTPSSH